MTAQSWMWGSGHRLFHTGLSACLGLDILTKTLSLTSCYDNTMLEWRCYEGYIITTFQMKLSVNASGTVTAKRDTSDSWIRGGTTENICEQPYRSKRPQCPKKLNFIHNYTITLFRCIVTKEKKRQFSKNIGIHKVNIFGENISMDFISVIYNEVGDTN